MNTDLIQNVVQDTLRLAGHYCKVDTLFIKTIENKAPQDFLKQIEPFINIIGTLLGVLIGFSLTSLKNYHERKVKIIDEFKSAIISHIDGKENRTEVIAKYSYLSKKNKKTINIESIFELPPDMKNKELIDVLRRM